MASNTNRDAKGRYAKGSAKPVPSSAKQPARIPAAYAPHAPSATSKGVNEAHLARVRTAVAASANIPVPPTTRHLQELRQRTSVALGNVELGANGDKVAQNAIESEFGTVNWAV